MAVTVPFELDDPSGLANRIGWLSSPSAASVPSRVSRLFTPSTVCCCSSIPTNCASSVRNCPLSTGCIGSWNCNSLTNSLMKSCSLMLELAGSEESCVCNTLPMASTDISMLPFRNGGAPDLAPIDHDTADRNAFLLAVSPQLLGNRSEVVGIQTVITQPDGVLAVAVMRQSHQTLGPEMVRKHDCIQFHRR